MAASWQDVLAHKAEEALGRLEDGMWTGLGLLRTGLGLDLGLEQWLRRQPPGSAAWLLVVGGAAALGLAVVLVALWAFTCGLGRLLGLGKRRGGREQQQQEGEEEEEGEEAGSGAKAAARSRDKAPGDGQQQQLRGEEQRRKNRRKERPKKSQPNGRAGAEPIEEEILQQIEKNIAKKVDAERKPEKTKKNKKKPKAEVKQAQAVSGNRADSKETDEGTWETKISSREKRQQRRRDKGINETSPGIPVFLQLDRKQFPCQHVTASAALASRKTKGVDNTASPGWGELSAVNGGGWSEVPVKLPAQISASKEDKWRPMPPTTTKGTDQPAWGQEAREPNAATKEWAVPLVSKTWGEHTLFSSIGAWTGVDGRVNPTDQKPPFSSLGMKAAVTATTSESVPQPGTTELQWEANPSSSIDDAWSGINGISTADPSSDWNAPTEEWGNWLVEESVSTPQPEETATEVQKVSDEEKEKVDAGAQGSASGKSKKKKKKKKKGEDGNAPAQVSVCDAEEQEKEATNGDKDQHVIQSQPEQQIVLPVETICTSESAEMRVSTPQQVKAEEAQPVTIAQEPDAASESSPQGSVSQVPDALSDLEPPASTAKHNSLPPSQVKSEESWESPKQIKKKKKARRET
ncbi:LOW QUALITY PROTEIN: metadherin a [Callorhinchus milii]|uniref:LOW QUALITY PROTEIN: metadherin a n=1 Tax=Callorhinchus milii TaxID=7868 RepID=UPI001C3FB09C|nr:LOW QUALITY PROTEIN: metadherin a [Callorhinchus milii]